MDKGTFGLGKNGKGLSSPAEMVATVGGKYTLALALLIVRRFETQATRGAVYDEIKQKNIIYRLVDKLYALAPTRVFQPSLLFLYMLKGISSISPQIQGSAQAVAIANFNNEKCAIKHVLSLVPESSVVTMTLRRRHVFDRGQARAFFRLLRALPRCWMFLNRLARSQDFMPACRIASALAYYIIFDRLFFEQPSIYTAIIASNYSPEAVALAAAAHHNKRHVGYINHAPVPGNSTFIPPVLADFSVFYGEATREIYEGRSRLSSDVILVGQPGKVLPMVWRKDFKTVGIFLTALTQIEDLELLVETIKSARPDMSILIRHHPVALLESDLSSLTARYNGLRVSRGAPLQEEITTCDMVFCGNSGVAMNVLRGGRPVAYLARLDSLPYDYNGFVANKLVRETDNWRPTLIENLKSFYDSDDWKQVMHHYDASFGVRGAEITRAASQKLRAWLNQKPSQD